VKIRLDCLYKITLEKEVTGKRSCPGTLKVNEKKADPKMPGDQDDKKDIERTRENSLGQEGLERCGCRPMPPGGQRVKKK
jgi:hypothetical protein